MARVTMQLGFVGSRTDSSDGLVRNSLVNIPEFFTWSWNRKLKFQIFWNWNCFARHPYGVGIRKQFSRFLESKSLWPTFMMFTFPYEKLYFRISFVLL